MLSLFEYLYYYIIIIILLLLLLSILLYFACVHPDALWKKMAYKQFT